MGINAAITAAGAGGCVCLGALPNYYLQTTIVNSLGASIIYTGEPVIHPSGVSPAANAVELLQIGNLRIDLPRIMSFTGFGVRVNGSSVLDLNIKSIEGCGQSLVMKAIQYHPVLDNTIRVQFMPAAPANGVGIFITSDNTNNPLSYPTLQGNAIYVNFFTGLRAVVWDSVANTPSWDGNVFHFIAIDCLAGNGYGGSGARCFQNTNAGSVPRNTMVCEGWMGGIAGTASMATAGKYIDGKFEGCEFKFSFADAWNGDPGGTYGYAYGTFNLTAGSQGNRLISIGGGGNYAAGYAALQVAANNRAAFGFSANNRVNAGLVLPGNIAANATQAFYFYTPLGGPSDFEISAVPTYPIGLVVEGIQNNCATNPNEYIITCRNVSGAQINSGTVFGMIITVGL